jgi:hypothetical protein
VASDCPLIVSTSEGFLESFESKTSKGPGKQGWVRGDSGSVCRPVWTIPIVCLESSRKKNGAFDQGVIFELKTE